MNRITRRAAELMVFAALSVCFASVAMAQGLGTIRGVVTDPSASSVPNAAVHVTGGGQTRDEKTDAGGRYTISIPPGQYTVRVTAAGFVTTTQTNVTVSGGQAASLDIAMQISASAQQVDVNEAGIGAVTTDPSSNAGALVLTTSDLDALPDDPDDLQAQLTSMAGPSAGPNGAQIFVDGFSGGQMPPKSSIREIRINSNPFASEFDRPGFGRIQILTRPGTDSYHASAFMTYGNKIFDTRNPYVTGTAPDYNNRQLSGNVSGPLGKKVSWFLDMSKRNFDSSDLINAQTLDQSNNKVLYNATYEVPSKSWSVNPRLDYAINPNNTLVLRYARTSGSSIGGVGGFNLPSQVTQNVNKNTTVQATETMVIGTKAVNEILFQLQDSRQNTSASGFAGATINVSSAFTAGGSSANNYNRTRGYEFQDLVTMTSGKHAVKFGARVRRSELDTQSITNFNGTYSFSNPNSLASAPCLAGISNPTSLDVYQQTQIMLANGTPISEILADGCGPTGYTLNAGAPAFNANQLDAGLFVQDDWRVKPNFTLSAGLRFESQTNVADKVDIAPRIAMSWAPGGKAGTTSKTVLRAGWGMFYDRFPVSETLNTIRYSGVGGQQNYNISSTTTDPAQRAQAYLALAYYDPRISTTGIPPLNLLATANQTVYQIDANLKSSYMMQSAFSMERALPGRTSLSVSITDSRGVHDGRTRSINTYFPGTNILPFPGQSEIYLYENTGIYKELQATTSVNTRVNSHVALNGYYSWTNYNTNSNGLPSNQYDTSIDYGRASGNPHHRGNIVGTVGLPFQWTASPSVSMSSATPFNIISGSDYNGDRIRNDRPSFAPSGAVCGGNIVCTALGNFNTTPGPGEKIIPINYGNGVGRFTADVRFSRSFGWGERRNASGAPQGGGGFGGGGGRGGGGGGAPRGGGGGGGGFGRGGGRGGLGSIGGGTAHRYNVTLTIAATNILNHVNRSAPVGDLSSPSFGESLSTGGGGRGGGGGGGGLSGGTATGNRRIQFTLRFTY